jgi:hypothetical protein
MKTLRAQGAAQPGGIARRAAISAECAEPRPRLRDVIPFGPLALWRAFARFGQMALRRPDAAASLRSVGRHYGSERSGLLLSRIRNSAPGRALWGALRRSPALRHAVERLRAAYPASGIWPRAYASDVASGPWQAPPAGMLPWFNPLNVKVDPQLSRQPHLNLLLPGIAMKHMSGGPNTAIALAHRLAAMGVPTRFISTDSPIDADSAPFWAHVAALCGAREHPDNAVLIDASNRTEPLVCGENDVFMATAWWTAQMAKYVVRHTKQAKFVYLIQDYEPLFHAASTQSALAEETYGLDCIPVVNSSLLSEYLIANRIGRFANPEFASRVITFEPAVDTTRFFPVPAVPRPRVAAPRKRCLLFYARPTIGLRNLYELGVAALHKLMHEPGFEPEAWEFLAMGEALAPVALGRGAVLRPLPWRDFDGYAQQMRESDVLLSLMLSPHPSNPPLEMAACGKPVVTTVYANKTAEALARMSSNIIGVRPTIEDICDGLVTATCWAARPEVRPAEELALPRTWDESFLDALPALHRDLLGMFQLPAALNGSTSAVAVH